jgi:hypothetical protein
MAASAASALAATTAPRLPEVFQKAAFSSATAGSANWTIRATNANLKESRNIASSS